MSTMAINQNEEATPQRPFVRTEFMTVTPLQGITNTLTTEQHLPAGAARPRPYYARTSRSAVARSTTELVALKQCEDHVEATTKKTVGDEETEETKSYRMEAEEVRAVHLEDGTRCSLRSG